jgi:DNA replication and repair protein RecF
VIWGENGSGKTSVLEAIHLLTYGKSFKTHKQTQLIKEDKKNALLKAVFLKKKVKNIIAAQVEKNNSKIKVNGKQVLNRKELIGQNNVVVLSPEEQPITKGAPLQRRQFVDKMFSVSNKKYINTLQEYNRALRQRNAVLQNIKEDRSKINQLPSWNSLLSNKAEKLWRERGNYLERFKRLFLSTVEQYDKTLDIKISYKTPEENKKVEILETLNKREKTDIIRGRTSFGPHKDDISFIWEGKNLREYGSQGEHKLTLFLLKVSEMLFLKKHTGVYPILLLDDLFAKLDLERSKKIVAMLSMFSDKEYKKAQTIITTTDILNVENSGLLEKYDNSKTIKLQR